MNAETTYRANAGYLICFIWLWERPRDVLKKNVGVHGIMQRAVSFVTINPLKWAKGCLFIDYDLLTPLLLVAVLRHAPSSLPRYPV